MNGTNPWLLVLPALALDACVLPENKPDAASAETAESADTGYTFVGTIAPTDWSEPTGDTGTPATGGSGATGDTGTSALGPWPKPR